MPVERRSADGFWMLNLRNRHGNSTFALISMCIKEDFGQSLMSLARRVAKYKSVTVGAAKDKLEELAARGELGYYDDLYRLVRWTPKQG